MFQDDIFIQQSKFKLAGSARRYGVDEMKTYDENQNKKFSHSISKLHRLEELQKPFREILFSIHFSDRCIN